MEEVASDASSGAAIEVTCLKPTTTKTGRVTKQPAHYDPSFVPVDRGKVARTLLSITQDARQPARTSRDAAEKAQAIRASTPSTRDIMTMLTTLNNAIV